MSHHKGKIAAPRAEFQMSSEEVLALSNARSHINEEIDVEVSTFEVSSGVTIPHELRRRVEEAVGMGPSKLRYFIYRCRTNKPVQSLGLDGDIFVTVSKQNKEIVYYRSSGIWVAYPPSNWSANSPVTNRHPLVRGIYLLHLPVLGWFPLNGSMLREARNHTTELLGPLGPLPASQPVVAQTSRHPSIPPLPATQPVNPTVSTWRASLGRPRSSRSLSSGRVSRGSSHGTPEEGGSSVKHPSPVQGASPTSQVHRIKLEEPEVEELEVTRHDDSWQTPSLIRDIENTPQPPLSFVANPPLKSVPSQWMSTPLQGAISPIPNTGRFHLTLPRTNGDKPTSSSIASSPSSFPTSNPPKSASECPPPATMENHDTPPAPSIIVERKSKRPRSDSSVSSTFEGQKYTPNARFWAQDGNVILAIGNVLFKLYRTRLSQASQHFARIFQSLDADTEDISRLTPGYEDCTVVPVSGVSPDDFEQLLVALDSGLSFVYNPPSFLTLASILRAAQTLSFMDISSFATRAIKDIWSSKIERVTSVPVPHAYEAFTLSKQFHMPCVTKRAAYELMRLEAFGLEDISWGNTTLGSSASEFADFGISKGDLVQLMKVRLKLQVAWYTVISSPQSGFGSVCTFAAKDDVPDMNSHCLSPPMREKHWNSAVTDSNVFERFMCDPLCGLNHLATLKWKQMGFCTGCVHKKKEVWRKCGEKIWEDMDLWLDLRTDE